MDGRHPRVRMLSSEYSTELMLSHHHFCFSLSRMIEYSSELMLFLLIIIIIIICVLAPHVWLFFIIRMTEYSTMIKHLLFIYSCSFPTRYTLAPYADGFAYVDQNGRLVDDAPLQSQYTDVCDAVGWKMDAAEYLGHKTAISLSVATHKVSEFVCVCTLGAAL